MKTLETKLRSAIRLIWSRSAERRAILKDAIYKVHIDDSHPDEKVFDCHICHKVMPDWAGEVDHEPPIGPLESWRLVVSFIDRMFFGPQFVVCKTCHRAKTKAQRRRK